MVRFRKAEDGLLIGRDVLVVALFSESKYSLAAADVGQLLERWLKVIPSEALEWGLVGMNASQFKPYTKAVLARARAELDPNKAAQKGSAFLALCGGEDRFNPSYGFTFSGSDGASPMVPHETCLVEMRFPSEFAEQIGHEQFVAFVRASAELLAYRSGYAAPALSRGWENMIHVQEGAAQLIPLAFRHPGYDLPENLATRSFMAKDKCRGARWLTLLGPQLVEQLGGTDALRAQLDPAVTTEAAGAGLMLRAGAVPEIGDVNRGQHTPLLRSVARAIEDVSYFEDWKSLGRLFQKDREQVLRWERRHLD